MSRIVASPSREREVRLTMSSRKAFLLRIDAELWNQIESWAAAELRSVNGQVEYLLREAVRRRRGPERDAPAAKPDEGAGPLV